MLLIIFLTISSLLAVGTAQASAYIKPSVPQFTVKLESVPYYVPTTYRIDPFTGENVTEQVDYWVKNESLVFTIKSQPFTPYNDTDGNYVSLTFNIRVKGHFEPEWTNLGHFDASGSEYTVKAYGFGDNAYLAILGSVPDGGKLDVQVDARVGYYTANMAECKEYFTGETSGWSETYTLTIGESQTPTPSPGSTPTSDGGLPQIGQIEMIFLVIVGVVLVAGIGFLVYLVKKK